MADIEGNGKNLAVARNDIEWIMRKLDTLEAAQNKLSDMYQERYNELSKRIYLTTAPMGILTSIALVLLVIHFS